MPEGARTQTSWCDPDPPLICMLSVAFSNCHIRQVFLRILKTISSLVIVPATWLTRVHFPWLPEQNWSAVTVELPSVPVLRPAVGNHWQSCTPSTSSRAWSCLPLPAPVVASFPGIPGLWPCGFSLCLHQHMAVFTCVCVFTWPLCVFLFS